MELHFNDSYIEVILPKVVVFAGYPRYDIYCIYYICVYIFTDICGILQTHLEDISQSDKSYL